MFEIFKNKKSICKSIGEIVTFKYTIEYIVPIPNALELHKSFVASEKQRIAIKRLSIDERSKYQVVEETKDLGFGKISTYIEVDHYTNFFLSTVESTQSFSGYRLTLQASNKKLRDLISPLPERKTINPNDGLLPAAVPNNALIPSAISVIKSTEQTVGKAEDLKTCTQNKSIPEESVLNFFPYNQLKMPEGTDLVFDKLVFLLTDNRKQTLDQAI